MARDTIVQIFSMTKPITGVALMQMFERGKFQLDDPLSNYLPEFAKVTRLRRSRMPTASRSTNRRSGPSPVRDILRHTAGFIGGPDDSPVGQAYRDADLRGGFANTTAVVSQKLAAVPLLYQPGTRWLYSDAVDIQAALLEKLSGVPFDEYLKLHVLSPLGMNTTRYTILPTDPDRAQLAPVYTRNDDGTFTRQTDEEAWKFNSASWPYKPGSFGLVATIDDYMKFARMLVGGGKLGRARILKPETVQAHGHRCHAQGSHRQILAAVEGPGGFRHRLRRARCAAQGRERIFGTGRRVLLGRRGQHAVLGRPQE